MKKLVLALAVLALMGSLGVAQFHKADFLCSGYYGTSTSYMQGLYRIDATTGVTTSLLPPGTVNYYIRSAMMDADNKNIVLVVDNSTSATYNLKSGIYRLDPATQTLTTIVMNNYGVDGPMYYQYRMMVDQDGAYVFGAQGRSQVTTPTTTTRYDYHILKYDASATLSTVFTSYMFNSQYDRAYWNGDVMTKEIGSGDILVNTGTGTTSTLSILGYYPWVQIDPSGNGNWKLYAGGTGQRGSTVDYGNGSVQNWRTGDIEETYSGVLYRQMPGNTSFTTIWKSGSPGNFTYYYNGIRDLRSAPSTRWVCPGYVYKPYGTTNRYASAYMNIDSDTFPPTTVSFVDCDPNLTQTRTYGPMARYPYSFDFFQSRNIQTVKTGANKWQVRYSCPNYPGKAFYAVIGGSGYKPGIPLPGGRTIWINFDTLVFLSLNNILLPFWGGGTGTLNANGEAQGFLNTSIIAPLGGVPVHIAMIVMDPAAPDGVAFIPDTYVMKLP